MGLRALVIRKKATAAEASAGFASHVFGINKKSSLLRVNLNNKTVDSWGEIQIKTEAENVWVALSEVDFLPKNNGSAFILNLPPPINAAAKVRAIYWKPDTDDDLATEIAFSDEEEG